MDWKLLTYMKYVGVFTFSVKFLRYRYNSQIFFIHFNRIDIYFSKRVATDDTVLQLWKKNTNNEKKKQRKEKNSLNNNN